MKRGFGFWAFVGIALVALAATASATIIGTSGQITKIAPPPSVLFDALESDTTMFAFDEQQNVTLSQPLNVDITTPGTYDDSGDLTPGTIPAGTAVSSQFVHSDPVGTQHPGVTLDGTVTTDKDILGIAILAKGLNDSDYLGAPGTLYPTGVFGRGLNLDNQDDFIIEQIDKRTVQIHSDVRLHSDQVRIITDGTPDGGLEGCTPGYWKQDHHFDDWNVYTQTDKFETVFGIDAYPGDPTLLDALNFKGGGIYALGRHAVAALLNSTSPGVAYPLTTAEVIQAVHDALASGDAGTIESTKNTLEGYNQQGAPICN